MHLARHASVLWRYRTVTAAGIGLAIVFAVLASYQVRSTGLTPRSSASWSATSSILVTQPGFPEGRVTLPQQEIGAGVTTDGKDAVPEESAPKDQLEFADPARLAALGDLYAKFLTSDEVLSRVPERPSASQVMASPFASSSGVLLPVLELKTLGPTGEMARRINVNTYKALRDYLAERQSANAISTARRVDLKLLVTPKIALESGVKPTASVLAFFLVLLGTLAFTHLLEALRTRRQRTALTSIMSFDPADPREDEESGPSVTRGSEQRAGAAGHPLSR